MFSEHKIVDSLNVCDNDARTHDDDHNLGDNADQMLHLHARSVSLRYRGGHPSRSCTTVYSV